MAVRLMRNMRLASLSDMICASSIAYPSNPKVNLA